MTPIDHVAVRIVSLVNAHSILVTSELHPGIDLARQLVSGQLAAAQLTPEQRVHVYHAYQELEARYQRLSLVASIFA